MQWLSRDDWKRIIAKTKAGTESGFRQTWLLIGARDPARVPKT
jgi:hypothetical protein